jgi:hypothetical protein
MAFLESCWGVLLSAGGSDCAIIRAMRHAGMRRYAVNEERAGWMVDGYAEIEEQEA